jgi:hypothetical protein
MSRLFTADYGNGNISQWSRVQNKDAQWPAHWWPRSGHYPNTVIVEDPDCGYVNRYECRDGDVPATLPSGERSDVTGDTDSFAAIGTTRWYGFSIKFDETYPTSHETIGWEDLVTFKGCRASPYLEYGSSVIGFGWGLRDSGGWDDGMWHMYYNPQSLPLVPDDYGRAILDLPLNLGQWHDIKVRAVWKQDSSGSLQVWHNGEAQVFNGQAGSGTTTFNGKTVVGGSDATGVMVHHGIYRQIGAGYGRVGTTGPTEIVYLNNFRMADSESSL